MTEIRRRLYTRRRKEGIGLTAGGEAEGAVTATVKTVVHLDNFLFTFLIGAVIKVVKYVGSFGNLINIIRSRNNKSNTRKK